MTAPTARLTPIAQRAKAIRGKAASAPRGDRTDRAPHGDRPAREGYQGKASSSPRGDRMPRAPREGYQGKASSAPRGDRASRSAYNQFSAPPEFVPVFGALPKDVKKLLESFPELVQSSFPLDSKKILQLPGQIRELSHELTDERGERRVGYLNDPVELSAYIRYYMWWNLVRLTRLFVSLPIALNDGDTAVDLGSGPLTLPIALWMARPDLRRKKISWYCVDISQGALAAGEELFLSLAAKTGDEPWQITRVKGECGISLRRKVALVASANMFNELFWDNPLPLEAQTKHHAEEIVSYADRDASILVIEPGIPRAGRFVSLLRDSLMRLGFSPVSPCPHEGSCPFPGLRYGKWCHFVFDTADAPAGLLKLSEEADLPKDRAALSFVFSKRVPVESADDPSVDVPADEAGVEAESAVTADATAVQATKLAIAEPLSASFASDTVSRLSGMFTGLRVRITSDPIKLPDFYTGRYGCSELGMVMVTGTYQAADYLKECNSGSLIEVPMPDKRNPERDYKTGAIIIKLK